MNGTDLDGHIVLFEEYIIHFLQFRWKFRVLGQKNAPISAENCQNDPYENKNTPFSPERLFYMSGNGSDGHICLVTGKYNAFPSISMEF